MHQREVTPLTKLFVELPEHWASHGAESLWACKVGDDLYRIETVPFFAYDLNYQDVVRATLAPDGSRRVVREVVRRSGHTTLRVVFRDASGNRGRRVALLSDLRPYQVSYEAWDDTFFALDVAPDGDVDAVLARLERFEKSDLLGFETCEARKPGSFDG